MALLGKIIGAIRSAAKSIFSSGGKRASKSRGAIHPPREIEYKDKKNTVKGWAKELGISEATLRWRIKTYGTLEKPSTDDRIVAFKDAQVIKHANGIDIEIDGVRKSLPEVAKELGIKYHTLANRIWKGRDIKEILAKVKSSSRDYSKVPMKKAKQWEWNGESHTAKEWAEIYHIKEGQMRHRLKTFGSPERNCERLEAYKANRAKKYEWNGATHTIAEWAKISGKGCSTIRTNLKRHGSPFAPPRNKHIDETDASASGTELYGFEGKWKPLKEWASEYGLSVEQCERNFTRYGEPIKPFDEEGDDTEPENVSEIDMLLREEGRNSAPKQSVKELLEEAENAADDETPLRETLGIPDNYHTLDKIVPKIS